LDVIYSQRLTLDGKPTFFRRYQIGESTKVQCEDQDGDFLRETLPIEQVALGRIAQANGFTSGSVIPSLSELLSISSSAPQQSLADRQTFLENIAGIFSAYKNKDAIDSDFKRKILRRKLPGITVDKYPQLDGKVASKIISFPPSGRNDLCRVAITDGRPSSFSFLPNLDQTSRGNIVAGLKYGEFRGALYPTLLRLTSNVPGEKRGLSS